MYKLYRADRYHEPICKGEYDTLEEVVIEQKIARMGLNRTPIKTRFSL